VVVWQDLSCRRLFLRRFDAAGRPLGDSVEIDPLSERRPGPMAVAATPDGRAVVVWEAEGDGDGSGIFARRFDPSDRPLPRGDVVQVNSHRPGNQSRPRVAIQEDGRFLVIWRSPDEDGLLRLRAQYFGAHGRPAGSDFAVDSRIPVAEPEASVATDPAGHYVVVWRKAREESITGRRYPAPPSSAHLVQ
jgi:hypothetical protein